MDLAILPEIVPFSIRVTNSLIMIGVILHSTNSILFLLSLPNSSLHIQLATILGLTPRLASSKYLAISSSATITSASYWLKPNSFTYLSILASGNSGNSLRNLSIRASSTYTGSKSGSGK